MNPHWPIRKHKGGPSPTPIGEYNLEGRRVAERALGKPLRSGTVVHHVNGDRADHRNCNLVICENEAYHRLLHQRARHFRDCRELSDDELTLRSYLGWGTNRS